MLLLPFQNSETALGVFTPVDHESSPGSTSHKHKVFRCGHLKALVTDNIMVRSGEAEARPHHIHPEQKKKSRSLRTQGWLWSVSLLHGEWVRTQDFVF